MIRPKQKELLQAASDVAASAATWADLSNALFDPIDGLVTKAYPEREERAAFLATDEYKKIRELLSASMSRTGLVNRVDNRQISRILRTSQQGNS